MTNETNGHTNHFISVSLENTAFSPYKGLAGFFFGNSYALIADANESTTRYFPLHF